MLKKLDELYNKIVSESIINLPKLYLEKGYFFAPKTPFQITSDMMVDLGTYDEEARPYAGKVTDILSNNEIIYEIIGTYSDDAKFKGLNNFPIIIKYTLSPNEQYYVFTNDEIEKGIPVLREYYEDRARKQQQEFLEAQQEKVEFEKYNFEDAGIDGSNILERAMNETESYLNNKNKTLDRQMGVR